MPLLDAGARASPRPRRRGGDEGADRARPDAGDDSGEADDAALGTRIRAAGFDLETLSTEELARRYGVEAAPLLVVSDPRGTVRYVGGYTDHKQSVVIRDHEILSALRGGGGVAALPVFGCAVSKELGQRVDPLGLRR